MADRLPPVIALNPKKGEQNAEWFHRLTLRREQIAADVERASASALASRILDVDRLRTLVQRWPASLDEAIGRGADYRSVLPRGAHVAQFLCWAEARADQR